MNESTPAKTATIKGLAIIGFFAIIMGGAWLLVQGLRTAPQTFSSLASIAETIQSYRPQSDLEVTTEKSLVNAGDAFEFSWTTLRRSGTYTLSYTCADNVSVDAKFMDGERVPVPCTDSLTLSPHQNAVSLTISSDGARMIEVPVTLTFTPDRGDVMSRSVAITVMNTTIPVTGLPTASSTVAETEKPVVPETKPVVTKPAPTTTPKPTQGASVAGAIPTTNTPKTITYFPQSNPSGYTDLKVSYLGVGIMDGNSFTPKAAFSRDDRGGIRFDVRNIGTKTSGPWTFTATLPGGIRYTSDVQMALKPNEHATYTLGFTIDSETNEKTADFKVVVNDATDKNDANDSFSWAASVIK